MGRAPCCDKNSVKKGPWSPEEDAKLKAYIDKYGTGGNWIALPHKVGLRRCGKSCRLRWLNYLRPNIKHGGFTEEEDRVICSLYIAIGSRWSIIAAQLPGRTDNDIKNYWNTKLKKKLFGKHNCIDQQTARRLVAAKQEQMTCHALQRLIAQSQRSSSTTTTTTTRKSTTATDTIHNYPQPIIQNNSQQPHDHSQTQQQPNQSFNYQHHNMNITNLCSNPTMMEQFAALNSCSQEPAAFPMHQEEDLSAIIRTQNQSVISYAGGPSSNSTSAAMAGGHGSPEFAQLIHRDDSQVLSSGSTSSEGNYESAWKCSIDAESLGAYAIPNIDTNNDLLMFASTSTSSDYSNYDQHSNVEFRHRIAGKNYETASMGVIDSASFYSSLYK